MKNFGKISISHISTNRYHIIIKKGHFFEVLGSYVVPRDLKNFNFLFLSRDRLFFWLLRGAICDLPAFHLIKYMLTANNKSYEMLTDYKKDLRKKVL